MREPDTYAVTLSHQSFTIKTSLRQGCAESLVVHTSSRTLILLVAYEDELFEYILYVLSSFITMDDLI